MREKKATGAPNDVNGRWKHRNGKQTYDDEQQGTVLVDGGLKQVEQGLDVG